MSEVADAARSAAEAFRAKYQRLSGASLPIDIFSVFELDMGLDVIPFDDLRLKYKIDAALVPNMSGIYVDSEAYLLWEKGPIWKQNRLRFTVAHEIGHIEMHRNEASKVKLNSIDEFLSYFRNSEIRSAAKEREADEFAGRLLVPLNRLKSDFETFESAMAKALPDWRDSPEIHTKFAEMLSPKYGVHSQSIQIRLTKESIWPTPR